MKIALISDTHGTHPELPDADVLVHAGDLTMSGTPDQSTLEIEWLGRQRHRYKRVVLIAGNHDFFAEEWPITFGMLCARQGLTYLSDSGCEVDGVKFWGSPVTPWFYDWAFNRDRGTQIGKHWKLIPPDTDVLITHGPPAGVLDMVDPEHVGCKDLLKAVKTVRPKLHVFGHIHEGRGQHFDGHTRYVNASVLDRHYRPYDQDVFVVDLEV